MRITQYTLECRNPRTNQWVRLVEDRFSSASEAIVWGLTMLSMVEWRWIAV